MTAYEECSFKEIQSKQPQFNYLDPGMILPVYDGLSTVNLPASVCSWLGCDPGAFLPRLTNESAYGNRFRHVVMVIIDGLGAYQMQSVRERLPENQWLKRIEDEGITTMLTSIVPSSTSAALTSIWNGKTAGQHGLAGYEMWLREAGMVVNYLPYSPVALAGKQGLIAEAGFPPEKMFPGRTLGAVLSESNIISRSHMPIMLANSNLTRAQMTGTSVIPYRRFGDLWENVVEHLERDASKTTFESIYWNDLDTYNHLMGMQNQRVFSDLNDFLTGLEGVVRRLSAMNIGETLILVTADHGHIENTPDPDKDLKSHPVLMNNLLILPCGENRLTYLYPRTGKEAAVKSYIQETWPEEFHIVNGAELIAQGVYGPTPHHPDIENRIGSLVAIARGRSYFWWPNRPDRLHSRHGGLSWQEMIVPLSGIVI